MARKITDTYPVFTITVGRDDRPIYGDHRMTEAEARDAREDFADLLNGLKAFTKRSFDVESRLERTAVCEHCGYAWTEKGADYNGGCCGKDEANNPERLKDLYELAERVSGGTFYRYDADRGRGRTPIDWPDQLGTAVCVWLDAGRPENDLPRLLSLAKHVTASEWCTVWEDPGPPAGQASLPRQPDRVTVDQGPEDLANELLSLLDDMGQLPATKGAAA